MEPDPIIWVIYCLRKVVTNIILVLAPHLLEWWKKIWNPTGDDDDISEFRKKDDNDDPVPRRDLTQCLQETLIASTSNLSGVPPPPRKMTSWQRFRRRTERFCLDFSQCWRGMSTWLAKKFPSRSKRIDVVARILFPLVFAIFNFSYWTFYLLQHESSKFNSGWKALAEPLATILATSLRALGWPVFYGGVLWLARSRTV